MPSPVQPRRILCVFLTLLTLFLLGTVVVLSTVVAYFGVDSRDVITEAEMRLYERLAEADAALPPVTGGKQEVVAAPAHGTVLEMELSEGSDSDVWEGASLDDVIDEEPMDDFKRRYEARKRSLTNGTAAFSGMLRDLAAPTPKQRVPKIVHQTWKTDTLPERWEKVRQGCMDLHPDYEYMLWSDASSRDFIATHYPWFLQAFDGYTYPIQRADAIRYFVLHHYGGIYMDLDVGCRRSMDPLLYFEVILPATIPVGVSNDVMLSEKGHPFMDLVIHNLVTFNHQYGTNYPTVMFSTGPMFLSAQYGLWPKDDEALGSERQVRILPRRWYGKNAPATEMGESFFTHFYGSSWHADDAGFITFLGKFGMVLMYVGLGVVILGIVRLLWSKRSVLKTAPRSVGPIALPFHVPSEFPRPGTPGSSRPSSPFAGSRSSTPNGTRLHHQRRESEIAAAAAASGRGVLYYLPVWFFPPGGDRLSASSNASPQSVWSQFLPGYDEEDSHRYQAIPDFSRPPSPSNDSILHAPGATHDGAFDGVHLHSISSSSRNPASPTSAPPAYSTLKSWGSALFRNPTPKPATAVLPFVTPFKASRSTTPHHDDEEPQQQAQSHSHSRSQSGHDQQHRRAHSRGHVRASSSTSSAFPHLQQPPQPSVSPRPSARPRSPLPAVPPQYTASTNPFSSPPSSPSLYSSPGPESRPGLMVRTGSGQGATSGVPSLTATTSPIDSSAYESTTSELSDDLEFEYESNDGRAVEEEVDRLLSEMAPEFVAKDEQ